MLKIRRQEPAVTNGWWKELRALFALSWPLALANVAQIAMSVTDVVMMGRLGPDTVAAGSLGTNLFFIALIIGVGLLNAISPMIARTLGRAPLARRSVAHTVHQGLWSAVILAIPSWLILWNAETILRAMGQHPALSRDAGVYLAALQWSLLPIWVFLILRAFVATLERPFWGLILALAGIVLNAAGNWCLMLGQCGTPGLGIVGSGLATLLASSVMAIGMVLAVQLDSQFRTYRLFAGLWTPNWQRLARIWRLGLPMAATLLFEMTVFSAAVFLMGLIGRTELAAHAIAIQIASLTFMVPLGIGQAATVRVGLAFGAHDLDAIRRAGWAAFAMATTFMAAMALVMFLIPEALISLFLDTSKPGNSAVIQVATTFLFLAAVFQIADGAQAVGGGMLRGLHDTRVPMLFALAGYWGIGLPLGAGLAFGAGLGGVGIWIGLAGGLAVVALLMMTRWSARQRLGLIPALETGGKH
ncbi:MAG: MATE family efflux transporter [Hyphomicrobiaceae bacterium]